MELDVLTIVASVLPFILRSSPVPQHDSALTGDMYYKEVMRSPNVNRFLNVARMDKDTFVKLKHFLWLRGNLRRSISVTVGQKVLILFMFLLGIRIVKQQRDGSIADPQYLSLSMKFQMLSDIAAL